MGEEEEEGERGNEGVSDMWQQTLPSLPLPLPLPPSLPPFLPPSLPPTSFKDDRAAASCVSNSTTRC